MNVMEMLQKQFQESANSLQSVQREYSKMLTDRQTLDSQLNENRQVRMRGQGERHDQSCKELSPDWSIFFYCKHIHAFAVERALTYVECRCLNAKFDFLSAGERGAGPG